jgi:PhnB protein
MSVQPELWVERPATAVDFYERAFGARVLHRVGDGEDIVAQLAVGEGAFWVGSASEGMKRFSPGAIEGGTCRILLTAEDPDALVERAVGAGATETIGRSPTSTGGVLVGSSIRSVTRWEIGRPPDWWPQVSS